MCKTVHLRVRQQKHPDKRVILERFFKITHFLKSIPLYKIKYALLYCSTCSNIVTCKGGKFKFNKLINKLN